MDSDESYQPSDQDMGEGKMKEEECRSEWEWTSDESDETVDLGESGNPAFVRPPEPEVIGWTCKGLYQEMVEGKLSPSYEATLANI